MVKEREEDKSHPVPPATSSPEKISEKGLNKIVNTINLVNFQDELLNIVFKHKTSGRRVSVKARPKPCVKDRLECLWTAAPPSQLYRFDHITICDGLKLTTVSPEIKLIDSKGAVFDLSKAEISETGLRKNNRHVTKGLVVDIYQNSLMYKASLLDFSADSFRVEFLKDQINHIGYINREDTVSVILRNQNKEVIYSGECRITRHRLNDPLPTCVLEPAKKAIKRFSKKEFRSERYKLVPLPNAVFTHPVTGKMQILRIEEISGAGISVIENRDRSVLIPGMVIRDLSLDFANGISIRSTGQVIYRSEPDGESGNACIKCGIAVIDMSLREQTMLSNILHRAKNEKSNVCFKVDMDDLWRFFFETGFIYPGKYSHINENKKKFKETYEKLYLRTTDISRHFTYHENGEILGHISMVRAYERTWLFHHHAAHALRNIKAGYYVLDQISNYVNDFYNLKSTHMRYIISFFRPQNIFPSRFFGGFARWLNDRKSCSVDSFSFLTFNQAQGTTKKTSGLMITASGEEDFGDLSDMCGSKSEGIMLSAMDVMPSSEEGSLSREYEKAGLKREIKWFSVKKYGELKALAMVSISDAGLNLSNLTSCIYLFVIDHDAFSRDEFFEALQELSRSYSEDEVQVMVYPAEYAAKREIRFEKTYILWALDVPRASDEFFRFMYSSYMRKQQ
jgi:hypothetical protein